MSRILIVDDKEENVYLLKVLLEGNGYTVDGASHGEQALELARRQIPNLVISDILMPVMDGFALCRIWMQDKSLQHIPFIFYTATYTDDRDRKLGMGLGAARFVVKPEEPEKLLAVIREVLKEAAQPLPPPNPEVPFHLRVKHPEEEESQHLKQYNEALIRKLEAKMAELEETNRRLQQDVVARKEAEAAMYESETRLRSLIDVAPEGIYIQNNGRFVFVNAEILRILGAKEPKEILGTPLMSRIAPEYHDLVYQRIRRQEETGTASLPSEQEYMRLDGTRIQVETIAVATRYEGRPAHMVLVRDISERKRSEIYRRLSLKVLAIVNHVDDFGELARQVVSVIHQITGCDAVGMRIKDGEDYPYFAQSGFDTEFLQTENSIVVKDEEGKICRKKDGSVCLSCICGMVLSQTSVQKNGRFTRAGSFWTNDVSAADLMTAEEMEAYPPRNCCVNAGYSSIALIPILERQQIHGLLQLCSQRKNSFSMDVINILEEMASHLGEALMRKRAESALRANAARQRAMISNIADVIAIIDTNAINRYKSPNVERWFGWRPEDLVGRPTMEIIHPDDRQKAESTLKELMLKPDSAATGECRYFCRDGAYKWIEYTAVNLIHDPSIQGILYNYHDITTRKRSEEERERLQAQLIQAQKMESVGRLAGGVAHDFNNMLTVIRGNADLALENLPAESPLRENLEEIQKCSKRSTDLTRQLLAFARKQTIAPKVLNLNDTVEGMLKMLRRLIGENIELSWKPGAGLWLVNIDPSQIDQLLANLCVNSKDAIGTAGEVILETGNYKFDINYCSAHEGHLPGDYVMLCVRDNGCGMSREVQEHLFEPFFTTKGVGQGTGLGLATVYGIVKQNNGFIQVQSEPGRGTTFRIYLPKYEVMTPAAPQIIDQALPRGTETILLVEDEKSILSLGRKILINLGYTVLSTHSPEEALRIAAEYPSIVHLLMTDVVMPQMSGRDLATQLLAKNPGMKCLFMSGYTADAIAQHGVLKTGEHFLQKPFTLKVLADKVRSVLDAEG